MRRSSDGNASFLRGYRGSLAIRIIVVVLMVSSFHFPVSAIGEEKNRLIHRMQAILRELCIGWREEEIQALETVVSDVVRQHPDEITSTENFLSSFRRYVQNSIASSTPPHQHRFAKPETVLAYLTFLLRWHVEKALCHRSMPFDQQKTLLSQLRSLLEEAWVVLGEQGIRLSAEATTKAMMHLEETARIMMEDGFCLGLKRTLTNAEIERIRRTIPSILRSVFRTHGLSEKTRLENLTQERSIAISLSDALLGTAAAVSSPEPPQELKSILTQWDREVRQAQKKWQEEQIRKFREKFALDILGASPEKEEQQFLITLPGLILLHYTNWGYPSPF